MKILSKSTLAVLFLLTLAYVSAQAREFYPASLGPYMHAKIGNNANDPATIGGYKLKHGFAFTGMPDIGATFYIPFEKYSTFCFIADLGYTTYAYDTKLEQNENENYVTKFNYITLGPSIYMSGFVLGLNFGLPLGGSISKPEKDIESENLAMMIELRAGGMFTLANSPLGRLNLVVNVGYGISGLYKTDKFGGPAMNDLNPMPLSVSLGFNYLFNLVDTEKEWEN